MTSYAKIAVSLPLRAAEHVRHAVRAGRASSVSAYIAEAIEDKAKLDDLEGLLNEMLAESGGPLTVAERRAADRALGGARPARAARAPRRRSR
jgi:Arc/MetJ-type ribon-helix-helix transcriptional regulator